MKNKYKFFNENKIFLKYKIFLIFIIMCLNNLNLNYSLNFFNINSEIESIEKYLKFCNNTKLINNQKFKKNKNPKVSIISPVFNREKYILRFLMSIQNQRFRDIETIFIDDFSHDESAKIIEEFQTKDNRIILLKHKKNRGTFISRNVGVLNSKGKYIILPDPDDILSRNIINLCYNILEIYNYEMIRFNLYCGNGKINSYINLQKLKIRPIYQPELSTYLFYGRGTLLQIDYSVSNKFIKREAYIRALNSLNNYYLNIYMTFLEDGLMNYILYRSTKTLYFIKRIGYYYIKNKESITFSKFKTEKLIFKFLFLYLKVIYEYSKNNKYEKDMANSFLFNKIKKKDINKSLKYLIKDFYFYCEIINMYLNCQFINNENKIKFKLFKKILCNKI